MSGHGAGRPAPAPEDPTEELPVTDPRGAQRPAPAPASAPGARPSRILERARERQAEYRLLANAVREHRRASRSTAIAITAADRRLHETLERLEQPN